MKNMRTILGIIVASVFLMVITISHPALGQEKFPSRPITLIVPFEPGAGTDLTARAIQPHAEKVLGQPIVVINKGGAAGAIGFTAGAAASPDGYTVTLLSPFIVTLPHTAQGSDVNIKKIDPVILVVSLPLLLTVRQDSPWKTFKEFIDYAKSNPGKIRISNTGHAGMYHIGAAGIEASTGVKFTHMPFKGSGPGMMAIIGGHVEAGLSSINAGLQLVKGGKLKALAVLSKERYWDFPDVPTFKELGIDFELSAWYGFSVPKGTPEKNVKIIHDAFKKAIETSEFRKLAKNQGMMVTYLGSKEFGMFMEQQDKVWLKVIEYAGLKAPK